MTGPRLPEPGWESGAACLGAQLLRAARRGHGGRAEARRAGGGGPGGGLGGDNGGTPGRTAAPLQALA